MQEKRFWSATWNALFKAWLYVCMYVPDETLLSICHYALHSPFICIHMRCRGSIHAHIQSMQLIKNHKLDAKIRTYLETSLIGFVSCFLMRLCTVPYKHGYGQTQNKMYLVHKSPTLSSARQLRSNFPWGFAQFPVRAHQHQHHLQCDCMLGAEHYISAVHANNFARTYMRDQPAAHEYTWLPIKLFCQSDVLQAVAVQSHYFRCTYAYG